MFCHKPLASMSRLTEYLPGTRSFQKEYRMKILPLRDHDQGSCRVKAHRKLMHSHVNDPSRADPVINGISFWRGSHCVTKAAWSSDNISVSS